jgi:L-fuconolactonase
MTVTDAHAHVSQYWREPVESLLVQMDHAGVDRAVLVCAVYARSWDYVRECAAAYPEVFRFVAAVHPGDADVAEGVAAAVRDGAAGVRMRVPREGRLTDGHVSALRAARDHSVSMSLLGWSEDFVAPDFAALLASAPGARVVVEHLGTLRHAGEEPPVVMRRLIDVLAAHDGVYLKFHGLGEFCPPKEDPFVPFPFEEPIPPFLDWAYQAFGANRLLWGSDYPNVCAREGYARCLSLSRDRFGDRPAGDLARLFDATADEVYAK